MSQKIKAGNSKILASLVLVSVSVLGSCGKKSDVTKSPPATGDETSMNLGDLKLSRALQVSMSSGLQKAANPKSGETSLRLTDQTRSEEACNTLQTVDELLANARSSGSFMCHMEVEKVSFGKKYNVRVINAPESEGDFEGQLWVDNSNAENLKVYYCEKRKLMMVFDISGYGGEGLIKGSSQMKFEGTSPADDGSSSESSWTYSANDEFDFTAIGTKIIKSSSKSVYSSESFSSGYVSFADLKLVDSGVSSLLVSKVGSYSTGIGSETPFNGTYDEQNAVLFNGFLGQALSKKDSALRRASFNSEGFKISNSEATADVIINKVILPAKLESTFSPTAPSGWDCATTESITIDLSDQAKKTSHDACEIDWPEFESCFGDGFGSGDSEDL